jgi:hypothetical protein
MGVRRVKHSVHGCMGVRRVKHGVQGCMDVRRVKHSAQGCMSDVLEGLSRVSRGVWL